jgi:hypothetical protein
MKIETLSVTYRMTPSPLQMKTNPSKPLAIVSSDHKDPSSSQSLTAVSITEMPTLISVDKKY